MVVGVYLSLSYLDIPWPGDMVMVVAVVLDILIISLSFLMNSGVFRLKLPTKPVFWWIITILIQILNMHMGGLALRHDLMPLVVVLVGWEDFLW